MYRLVVDIFCMTIRASIIIILGSFIWSCGRPSETKKERIEHKETEAERIEKIAAGKKRPLRYFNEEDVARYAMSVFKQRPVDQFESHWTEDGVLVTAKQKKGLNIESEIKIGGDGLLLYK